MTTEESYDSAIAIIGMSGRFPGAADVETLWANLTAGNSGLRRFSDDELLAAGISPADLADPAYVRVGGTVDDVDQFDASVFGVNPREAALMDPQHRMFLECSWEALEVAGYCPTGMRSPVGVFAGCGFPDYIARNLSHMTGEPGASLLMAVGNERDSLASLVSYKLGLNGPSLGVQTFCSTSLVSVHLACQSLLTYECDVALAGGAFVPLPQPTGYTYAEGGILSPDGVVRSFEAGANGTVMGSGVGVVTLKRMPEAIEDGDVIHAVVLGSAVNNDGRDRVGYTAPGVNGEADVIEQALGVANVKPESIGYLECHATGTSLGDSIELAALTRAFAGSREEAAVLSTLKPTLGHLDRASGVVGLIRAAMTVRHKVLPGTPNYRTPNPALASAHEQFTVLQDDAPWEQGEGRRRAGVSSFGLGGTNAHVVIEEAPPRPERPGRPGPHLLVLSARDEAALTCAADELRAHIVAHPELDIADIAYTLQVSRGGFGLRRAVVCRDRSDAVAALAEPSRWIQGTTTRRDPCIQVALRTDLPHGWRQDLSVALGRAVPDDIASDQLTVALTDWLTEHGVRVGDADTAGADHDESVSLAPPVDTEDAGEWLLARLADLWIAGSPIAWGRLHGGSGRRVVLPTYPFQRRRYWVDPPEGPVQAVTEGKTFDRARWTYLPTWEQTPAALAGLDEAARAEGPWLVLSAEEVGDALVERLRTIGADVVAVRPGPDLELSGADKTVRLGEPADLAAVVNTLPSPPRVVVHGFSLASGSDPLSWEHFAAEQRRGLTAGLDLAAALVDDAGEAPRARLILLTSGAVDVQGGDLTHPEHASLGALAPTLAQENPRIRSRHIDVATSSHQGRTVTQVLANAVGTSVGQVAVRGGETWSRHYRPHPTAELEDARPAIRAGETVLITGGLGDVGLTMARHLASRYGCNLVLTTRTALPPREEWDEVMRTEANDDRAARHVRNLSELESSGAQVLAMSADVADESAMRDVVDAARARFDRIDMVVHAAGVQDSDYFHFAHRATESDRETQFAAKVGGFHVLQSVLGDEARDRRIAVSSLAAVLGGITLGVYASASAALDAYAAAARARDAGDWTVVDWDTWRIDANRVDGHSDSITEFAMAPHEALDVFERAVVAGSDVARLVVSTGDIGQRLEQWVHADLHADRLTDDEPTELHPRPDLSTPYEPPSDGTEEKLARIWTRVLGIEQIGALDSFFELGGHSLLAMELTQRIRAEFTAGVPVTGLLESPTIRDFAALLDASEESDHGA